MAYKLKIKETTNIKTSPRTRPKKELIIPKRRLIKLTPIIILSIDQSKIGIFVNKRKITSVNNNVIINKK